MTSKPRYKRLHFLAGLLSLLATAIAHAAPLEVDGVIFEDTETVANSRLLRNGASSSTILSAKATAVGLYMAQHQTTPETAFAQKGPKRIRVYALREISARDLANVLLDRIRQNTTREEVENNVLQLAALGGAFSKANKLNKGDTITLDYIPLGQMTEIRINGELATNPIQGDQFYPLIMKVWLGNKVKPQLRTNLLGGENGATAGGTK